MKRFMTKPVLGLFLNQIIPCFLLGYGSAYAMAPTNYWPLLFAGLSGLYIILIRTTKPWHAALSAYVFGLGYFVAGLSWIGNAFEVEGNPFSWVLPLAIIGLPMLLSLFPALSAYAARKFFDLKTLAGFVAFVALLGFSEWLRGHIFSGFPWNLYGHAWGDALPMLQILSLTDVYFLTLFSVFWMTLPGYLIFGSAKKTTKISLGVFALLTIAGCYFYGAARLQNHSTEYVDNTHVRIVQPNIPQADKWQRDKMVGIFYKHIQLSFPDGPSGGTTYVIWPETALNRWFADDYSSMRAILDALAEHEGNAYLLTGMLRYNEEEKKYFNSLVMFDDQGEILNTYDKSHLVPFGEYIPLKKWIPLAPVVQFEGFQTGNGPQSFFTPENLEFSPLICYEVIFSGKAVDRTSPPDFMVNVTNDGWYGRSAGPYQHFQQAIFRAIEEGIPLVRSANTGISGLIDPYGRTLYKTDLFEENAVSLVLPKKIASFRKNSYAEALSYWGILLCAAAFALLRRKSA